MLWLARRLSADPRPIEDSPPDDEVNPVEETILQRPLEGSETYALRDRERSCYVVPGRAAE